MKNLLWLLVAFATATGARAQTIHFEKDSLPQVFAAAQRQHKPVLVVVAAPPPSAKLPAAFRQLGLHTPAVVSQLNRDFLNKELAFGTPASRDAVRQYQVTSYPTYLYFAPDGSLLYRNSGSSSSETTYLRDLANVQTALADPHNLSYFRREYAQGNRAADFLRQYVAKLRQLKQLVEPAVLDAYVQQLPVQALGQLSELVFILENGPVLNSKAYLATRLDYRHTDSLFLTLPSAQRLAFNNAIIRNSLAEAIATKDQSLARLAADFSRRTWTKNYQRGMASYNGNMLSFYQATKDTANYLGIALMYYDNINRSVSADSARKAVAAQQAFQQAMQESRRPAGSPPSGATGVVTRVQAVPTGGDPAAFLQSLNNGAWGVYQTGTRNLQYLSRALLWSKRTVDLAPTAYNSDTLAHLLYRLGFFSEAEARQSLAVALAIQAKASPTTYQQELQKIKSRTL
jgi:hypothetical protein